MSFFAKVLICINAACSLVLCMLLAVLLAHKFDYKTKYRMTSDLVNRAKSRLDKMRQESLSARQTQSAKLARVNNDCAETDAGNKTRETESARLGQARSDIEREVSRLEGTKTSEESAVKELQDRAGQLREEIANLEKEREDKLTEAKGFDQQRDEKIKQNYELLNKLRDEEKQLDKLLKRLLELENLWFYIAKNYPGIRVRPAMPEIQANIVRIDADIIEIDAGRDQGVVVGGLIELSRPGRYVGTIEIRNVDKSRSWGVLSERGPGAPATVGDMARNSTPIGPRK